MESRTATLPGPKAQSPEPPAAHSGRDPSMPLLYPSPHFSQVETLKGSTFRSLAEWEREMGRGCSELPTRSASSHPHEVNFFNAGGGDGLRGPGDRGPAQGPECREGSTRDLAWAATAGLCPRDRPWGDRVVARAPRTGGAEGRGRPTLLRPAEDTELRKAPAGMGWLSRGRGKPGPAN